jgi:hypothetical protein
MVRKRLFLHPTFDCSFDHVCREDCYLLNDKTADEKKFRLPDEYWVNITRLAGESGFKELSLPINPLRGVTGVKDPLHWLRLLAPVAKEFEMVINITTTLDVAQKIEETDIVDIIAISIDDYRTGKDWNKYAKKLAAQVERLQGFGIEVNCNLSYDSGTQISFLFNRETRRKFLVETFDYTTALWPKPLKKAGINTIGAARLIQKGQRNGSDYPDLIGESEGFLEDYCMSFARGNSSCDAGYGQLSIDAFGRLAICPYSPHGVDVSTPEKFQDYLVNTLPKNKVIESCDLIDVE